MSRLAISVISALLSVQVCTAKAGDASEECYKSLETRRELSPLKDKVALASADDQNFSMLIGKERVKRSEKKALEQWLNLLSGCFRLGAEERHALPSVARRVEEDAADAVQEAGLLLYEGKTTYGEFAKRRKEIAAISSSRLLALQQAAEEEAAKAKQHAAEKEAIARRREEERAREEEVARQQAQLQKLQAQAQMEKAAREQQVAACQSARLTMQSV